MCLEFESSAACGGGGRRSLTKWGINFQLNFPLKVLEGAAAEESERERHEAAKSTLQETPSSKLKHLCAGIWRAPKVCPVADVFVRASITALILHETPRKCARHE